MIDPQSIADDVAIITALVELLGADAVTQAMEKRTFFSTDISRSGETALAVIAPATADLVAKAVALCTGAGIAVIPRGGGFSYTGGYLPVSQRSIIIDMRRLDTIAINREDMLVIVDAGVTWANLYEALKAEGLRTPYFGPMSGYGATVGGALSQGSFFLGSTQYGQVAESVLAAEVVLADGSLLRTGSWGGVGGSVNDASPFLRNYGPDLTGLFLNDTGALGFKTRAVLKLIMFPPHQEYASIAFDEGAAGIAALSDIARRGLAAECYLWDPYFVKIMATASLGLGEDLKFLAGVARGGSSLLGGLKNAGRIALAGRSAFAADTFVLNVTIDDFSAAGASARLAAVHDIAAGHGGRAVTPTAPMAMRGTPFINFNAPDRRVPRRNLPVHGLINHSGVQALNDRIREAVTVSSEALAALGVECGVICFAVGAQAVCIEPLVYWEDERQFLHDRARETSDLAGLADFGAPPPATIAALDLRNRLAAIFADSDAGHVQIGKSYPWLATRSPAVARLAHQLKDALDPKGLVNPGSLGFKNMTDLRKYDINSDMIA